MDGIDKEKVYRQHLLICAGTSCIAGGCRDVRVAIEEELAKHNLAAEVRLVETGCNGFCAVGPIMVVYPDGVFYQKLTPAIVPRLVSEHFLKGRPLTELFYQKPTTKEQIPMMQEIGFFGNQVLRALRNRGVIDPESIDEYIGRDGYKGLAKALTEMTPDQIIDEVKISGLRGRGGGGFPTGTKWAFCAAQKSDVKYVLCNADEGDPGAFMDRSVLEADPHAVLEGMAIAAKALGAHEGHIYVRAEYPLAIERLHKAIAQAHDYGLLGKNIFETGFDFDIGLYYGAGAFVCGEETALMNSIMGKRGMPRPRPPFPAVKGLWNKPTVLNNVETFANIPQIVLNGGKWYASLGTEGSKGTKVFAVTGDINNIGLVEVPMGTPLRKIIYDICDGIKGKRALKAVQMGGPSGGCIPAELMDTPVDFESIVRTGAIMGSGGMVVMDETSCMVDMAKFFLEFTQDESCGKCPPCRIGTKIMLDVLQKICDGKGVPEDLPLLEELAYYIKSASLCGLGQTAPNPVLTTIRYFRHEYEAHIQQKECPSHVCVNLLHFEVMPELCKKCGRCKKACPVEAIAWEKKQVAVIDKEKCIKCRSCYSACPFMSIR
jgi:NADH-quinone oxidoreductase subunit F/NAD(P)H dehydrogenase (quinone)/NADP-reducing hydrogenase subunit HndC